MNPYTGKTDQRGKVKDKQRVPEPASKLKAQGKSSFQPADEAPRVSAALTRLVSDIHENFRGQRGPNIPAAECLLSDFSAIYYIFLTDEQAQIVSDLYLTLTRIHTALKFPVLTLSMVREVLGAHNSPITYIKNPDSEFGYKIVMDRKASETLSEKAKATVMEAASHMRLAYARLMSGYTDGHAGPVEEAWTGTYMFEGNDEVFDREIFKLIQRPMFEGRDLGGTSNDVTN